MTCGLTDIVNFCLAMGGIFLFTGTFGALFYAVLLDLRWVRMEEKRRKKIDEEFPGEELK